MTHFGLNIQAFLQIKNHSRNLQEHRDADDGANENQLREFLLALPSGNDCYR